MIKLVKFLLMPFIGLIVVFLGANVVAERIAEDRIAVAVREQLGMSENPQVDIGGFPVLLDVFVRRQLQSLTVRVDDVRIEGLDVEDARVELRKVEGGDFLEGDLSIRVGSGTAIARVSDRAINAYLRERDARTTVRFRPGVAIARATRVIGGRERRIEARGRLRLRNNVLEFVPTRVTVDGDAVSGAEREQAARELNISVRVPTLFGGIRPDTVEVERGYARLTAEITDTSLQLR